MWIEIIILLVECYHFHRFYFQLYAYLIALFFYLTNTCANNIPDLPLTKIYKNIIKNAVAIFRSLKYIKYRLMPFGLTIGIFRPLTETVMSGHISALNETAIRECFATQSVNLALSGFSAPIFCRRKHFSPLSSFKFKHEHMKTGWTI